MLKTTKLFIFLLIFILTSYLETVTAHIFFQQ